MDEGEPVTGKLTDGQQPFSVGEAGGGAMNVARSSSFNARGDVPATCPFSCLKASLKLYIYDINLKENTNGRSYNYFRHSMVLHLYEKFFT